MKRIVFLLASIILCFNISYSQEVSVAKSSLEAEMDNKEMAGLITQNAANFPNNTQLSIAIIDGDKTTFLGIMRDSDELLTTTNKNSIFEIGSISKVFTSLLLAKQVQAQKLGLNDKLNSFLTFTEKASDGSKEITLQMLANHTSGLPRIPQNMIPVMMADQSNPYKNYTAELLKDFYKDEVILENDPNTTYAYSNLGAGTLGYVLSDNAGMSYEELLQQDILKPLGMVSSSSLLSQIDEMKLVAGLNPDGTEASNWDFTDALVGAGGIKSSAVDMEKFIRNNFETDVAYDLAQQSTFSVSSDLSIGLGWHISAEDGKSFHWHNGGTGGYRSCMVLNKESKKAVLILSNVSAFGSESQNIDKLCFDLMRTLF